MSHLNNLKSVMISLAAEHKLPEIYQDDITTDVESLDRFDGLRLVWLLRSCGSVLVPAEVGVNPIYITHWLWSNHGQQVVPFSVDTRTGLIEKIDFEQAEKLIMQMPCNLSSLQNKEYLVDRVNRVLQRGCEMRIWGIFESPSSVESVGGWKEWQSYFSSTGNRLMADFVGKAIRFTNPR
ncbi:hypothetical protein FTV90_25870 (plasmid) [Escherichia coli]|nr:hypothetical protein FTV90_25870 [Escherichia coli]